MKTKIYTKDEIMSIAGLFHITDLPDEKRKGVMKIVNPIDWYVIKFDLPSYEQQSVKIKFSAEVKREGARGNLRWQINNKNYPVIGKAVSYAKTDIWHRFDGEWTGTLTGSPPVIYLSTWRNDSERTAFYIDNIAIEMICSDKT